MRGIQFSEIAMFNPKDYTVVELKEVLRGLGSSINGSESELIARLKEADPSAAWIIRMPTGESNDKRQKPLDFLGVI